MRAQRLRARKSRVGAAREGLRFRQHNAEPPRLSLDKKFAALSCGGSDPNAARPGVAQLCGMSRSYWLASTVSTASLASTVSTASVVSAGSVGSVAV